MSNKPLQFTIRSKLIMVFGALSLLLLSMILIAFFAVRSIRLDAERVFEESREAQIAQSIVLDLKGVQRIQNLKKRIIGARAAAQKDLGIQDQLGHLRQAKRSLAEFFAGPKGTDPSEAHHEASEDQILTTLEARLETIEQYLSTGMDIPDLEPTLLEAARIASVLADETAAESNEALSDLDRRARQLLQATFVAIPITLAVLAFVYFMFARAVLRPVLEVQRGAALIGSGNLDHRIRVRSQDEFGALCREINLMADRLQASQEDLEERVQQRTRQLIRAGRLADLGTIAAGIAHEINNPLASIASCAEGLQARIKDDDLAPDVQEEYLEIIAKEAYRARDIAARLLDFARHEPGELQSIDLAKGIREIEILLKHELDGLGMVLVTDIEADLPAVLSNEREWKQVLLNLLKNSIESSAPETEIRVVCRRRGDRVEVSIEDQAGGISESDLEKVFDPFFTTKGPGKGTGMGLAIVHSIVERHRGTIEVSNGAEGACFTISYPTSVEGSPSRHDS